MTRGEGPTPTTAVFAGFIWLPWVIFTLTRTSCRALPRRLTHTVIGSPVVRGNRFAISKRSSVSAGRASSETVSFAFIAVSLTLLYYRLCLRGQSDSGDAGVAT